MNIDDKLKFVIANVANQEADALIINKDTILTSDFGFDSVQIIELIVEIETEFGIEIGDEDLDIENLTVYEKLYAMIERKINH